MNDLELLDRVPPYDLDIESSLVAACILDPKNIDLVTGIVTPDDFYDSAHQTLFKDLLLLHQNGEPTGDIATLNRRLKEMGDFELIGGMAYLFKILDGAGVKVNHAVHYAGDVRKLSELRRQIEIGREMMSEAYNAKADPSEIAANCQAALQDIIVDADDSVESIGKCVMPVLADFDKPVDERRGLFTGIMDYDTKEGPWMPGESIILAAKTSIGKTALACQVALHNARKGRSVLFVSLEMTKHELTSRIMCGLAGVDGTKARSGTLSTEDKRRLLEYSCKLRDIPFHIWNPRKRRDMIRIGAKARMTAVQYGLELLIIDYMQLVEPRDRKVSRDLQVGEISESTKHLATDLDVPILSLCQFNRKADEKGKPQLHHLRESGRIEQDASTVIFVHREDRYAEDTDLIIAKHRFGKVGELPLKWDAIRQQFTSPVAPFEEFEDWGGDDDFR